MDTNIKPKVSIQMCTFNRAQYIEQAIQSVISQTFTNWELLVLDDASTDNTEEILLSYKNDERIKYLKNNVNLGIAKNRNRGLRLSTGEYIAVLDSDDYWIDNTKLEKQVKFLDENPEYSVVGTNIKVIDEKNTVLKKIYYPIQDNDLKSVMLIKNNFCHSSVVYRKNTVEKLRGYDENLILAEDYDLFLRIGTENKLSNLDLLCVAYRQHPNQSYSNKKKTGLNIQKNLIKKYKNNYKFYYLAIFVNWLRNFK